MRDLVEGVGFVEIEIEDPDENAIFELMKNGRCMLCKNELAENSNFILTRFGIAAAYCCGQCHSDMAVMGWIQEQFDDIQSAVKFRGDFPADGAEETDEDT